VTTRPYFGYHMPSFSYPGIGDDRRFEYLARLVGAAEEAGFDLVTVMDHLYQIRGVGAETEPMLEAYTTLGALAARTSRVALGTLLFAFGNKRHFKLFDFGFEFRPVGASCVELRVELVKAIALRHPLSGSGGRISCCNKAIPAPKVALDADQPLSRLERGHKRGAPVGFDEADLI